MPTELENDNVIDQNDDGQQQNNNNNNNNQNDTRDPLERSIDGYLNREDDDGQQGKAPRGKGQQDQGNDQGDEGGARRQPGARGRTQQSDQGDGTGPSVQPLLTTPRQYGAFKSDARGNIYDDQGRMIAGQGYGHKVFRNLYPHIERAQNEAKEYKQQLDVYTNANQVAKNAGLSIEEQSMGISFMAAWKKDPVKTLNGLLTLAREQGKDVSSIVQGGGGVPDMAAFRQAMKEEAAALLKPFEPFVQERDDAIRNRQMHEEAMERAREDVEQFTEEFPDSVAQRIAISNVMADKGWDMRAAYFACKQACQEQGLDWSKDIIPQIQSLRQRNGASNGGNRRRLPDMGGRTHTGATVPSGSRNGPANVNSSYDDIISEVFDEMGIEHR